MMTMSITQVQTAKSTMKNIRLNLHGRIIKVDLVEELSWSKDGKSLIKTGAFVVRVHRSSSRDVTGQSAYPLLAAAGLKI